MAQDLADVRKARAGVGELPVHDADEPLFVHEDVGGLEVAVDEDGRSLDLTQARFGEIGDFLHTGGEGVVDRRRVQPHPQVVEERPGGGVPVVLGR